MSQWKFSSFLALNRGAQSLNSRPVQNEGRFLTELVEGLIHEFPLCCVLAYCSDIYHAQEKAAPASKRGTVKFRTFSLHRAESLFNGLDRVGVADHFVPCEGCTQRFLATPIRAAR